MRRLRQVLSAGIVAGVIGGSFAAGQLTGTQQAAAAPVHRYTLRMGDRVSIPAVGQTCSVESESGFAELFCSRPSSPHHQVTFFRDRVLVWRVGDPDRPPVWSGRP